MNSTNVVLQPSDYLDAIKTKLESLLAYKDEQGAVVPFFVEAYSEFGKTALSKPSAFIEITKAKGTLTRRDGRIYEVLDVAIHSVFPNSMPNSGVLANNSSFDIREIIILDLGAKDNQRLPHWRWQLHSDTVKRPENVDRMPSMFADGAEGYEAWCVSFTQEVTYGPIKPAEAARESIFIACNDDIDDADKYQELKI